METLDEVQLEPNEMVKEKVGMVRASEKNPDETVNIRAVAQIMMEGEHHRRKPCLRWKDIDRRDMKAWNIRIELAINWKWKVLHKARCPAQGDGGESWSHSIYVIFWHAYHHPMRSQRRETST